MVFNSLESAESYKKQNFAYLDALVAEALQIESVEYADVWLNSKAHSFVAGFNDEDEMIVCLKI